MEIEIRTVEMDEPNEQVELHFVTEDGHRFNKIVKIDEDTDTKEKLKKHIESMAAGIAAEFVYDEVTFEFQTNAFFYEPPEEKEDGRTPAAKEETEEEEDHTEDHTEEQLMDMLKDELIDIAEGLGLDTDGTKTELTDRILGAQE